MYDFQIRKHCAEFLRWSISDRDLYFPNFSKRKDTINKITKVLSSDSYQTKLKNLGFVLAKDSNGSVDKATQLAPYLYKLFAIPVDKAVEPLNPNLAQYLDTLISTELAYAHRYDLDDATRNKLRTKISQIPILKLAMEEVDRDNLESQTRTITLPESALQALTIDPKLAKDFTDRKYTIQEIITMLQRDILDGDEVKFLAIPLLKDLAEVYIKVNQGPGYNPELLDKLNNIVLEISPGRGVEILDRAALVYFLIEQTKFNIEESNLTPQVKTDLGKICNTLLFKLIYDLRKSSDTDFYFRNLSSAFKNFQTRVADLGSTEFQEMELEDLRESIYIPQSKSKTSSTKDIFRQMLYTKREFNKLKAAVHKQWQKNSDLQNTSRETLIQEINNAQRVSFLPDSSNAAKFLLTALELLESSNCKRLIIEPKVLLFAFLDLNRYGRRFGASLQDNTVSLIKDFLENNSTNDLQVFLGLSNKEISGDEYFKNLSMLASKLKGAKDFINIVIKDTKDLSETDLQYSPSNKTVYFGSRSKNATDKDLILNYEHISTENNLKLRRSQKIDFCQATALAAYKLRNKSFSNKPTIVMNDLNDQNFIQSIESSHIIRPLEDEFKKCPAKKLLVTTFEGNDNQSHWVSPSPKPVDRVPSPDTSLIA